MNSMKKARAMKRAGTMKAKAALALAAVTAFGAIGGCSGGNGNGNGSGSGGGGTTNSAAVDVAQIAADLTPEEQEALDAGLIQLDGTLPIIKDKAAFEAKYGKIKVLNVGDAQRVTKPEDIDMVKKWTEDTGLEFEWQTIPPENAGEKISLMLTAGENLPDVFWNFEGSQSGITVVQYAGQDVFVPTEQIVEDYMPNLKKILDDNPEYSMEVQSPDGHMYGFPWIEQMKGLILTPGPFVINKTWLDQVGKEVPTTVDEWVDCLKAFRDGGDLNGNGKADEIPMACWFGQHNQDGFGSYNLFYRFTGAFGMADSYCGGNPYADHLRIIDGKVTFTAADEAFKKTAEFFNMLYNEGLIWEGSFENDESAAFKSSLIKEDVARIGSFGVWGDQEIVNLDVHDEYVPLPRLEGENGKIGFALNTSEMQDSSIGAITVNCKFPHLMGVFYDYIYGNPQISIQTNWGALGYNYEIDDAGLMRTPLDENGHIIAKEPWTDFGQQRANTTVTRTPMAVLNGYYDTVVEYTFDAVTLYDWQIVNGKEEIMAEYDTIPKIMMTTDEISRLAQIQPTVSNIVDRYISTWITGGVDDAGFENYKKELEAAGVNDIVEIYQTAYDRAKAASN